MDLRHLYRAKIALLTFALFPLSLFALIDLESNCSDFLLETKRIEIPNHPHAFNPSIVQWNGLLVMSFREIPFPYEVDSEIACAGHSRIGIVLLNEDFLPINEPQMLQTQENPSLPCRSEDARLAVIGEDLYLIYSDNHNEIADLGGFRVYIAKVAFDGEIFTTQEITRLSDFDNADPFQREKNWTPFNYYGNLLLAYYVNPHRIYYANTGSEICTTVATSQASINWEWGEMRGGTPAILVDGKYLSFFHSSINMKSAHSNGKEMAHYFMGAYTFSASPPFEVTHVSPEPIIGKGFYSGEIYQPYWKPVRVVFPCGIISDKNCVWVSYGRQDHEIWIAKFDKKGLLDSLVKTSLSGGPTRL